MKLRMMQISLALIGLLAVFQKKLQRFGIQKQKTILSYVYIAVYKTGYGIYKKCIYMGLECEIFSDYKKIKLNGPDSF